MKQILVIGLLAIAPVSAFAQEGAIALKDAPGKAQVEGNCAGCHSLAYIQMNSPFLDKAKWEATVKKMMAAFGAPIEQKDVPVIVEYLAKNYGG